MNPEQSDDEIIAEERRRFQARNRFTIATFVYFLLVGLGLVWFFNTGLPHRLGARTGIPEAIVMWLPLLLLIALWVILALMKMRFGPQPERQRPSVQRKMIDDYKRLQRRSLIVLIAVTLLLSLNRPAFWLSVDSLTSGTNMIYFVYVLLACLTIVFGPGFLNARFPTANNDELSRAQRARATQIGYIGAVLAMAATYTVSMMAPNYLGQAFPLALAFSFTLPALYLLWADIGAE